MADNTPKIRALQTRIIELENQLDSLKNIEQEKELWESRYRYIADYCSELTDRLFTYHSIVNMPELTLDESWRITGFSHSFFNITYEIANLANQRKHITSLISKATLLGLQNYVKELQYLKKLDFVSAEPWEALYKWPDDYENLPDKWEVSLGCRQDYWNFENTAAGPRIIHDAHTDIRDDCYLMCREPLDENGIDIRVEFSFRTASEPLNIRDVSFTISGTEASLEILPDKNGYTICLGSMDNRYTRIQRCTANMRNRIESLEPDTDYHVQIEKIGGYILLKLKNLRTGLSFDDLEFIDNDPLVKKKGYLGFVTYNGYLELYDIAISTRKSKYSADDFRKLLSVQARLQKPYSSDRLFNLRLGINEQYSDRKFSLLFEDITEKQNQLDELSENERKYRSIFENATIGIFRSNLEGTLAFVNPACARMLKYDSPEDIAGSVTDIAEQLYVKPGIRREIQKELIKTGGYVRRELDFRCKNGEITTCELNIWAVKNNDGKVTHLEGFIDDVTGIRKAELEARLERDRTQKYLDIVGVMMLVLDTDANITLINRKGCEILEGDEKDFLGKNWIDNFIPDYLQKEIKTFFNSTIKSQMKLVATHENPIKTLNGKEKLISFQNSILYDDNGGISGVLSSGLDITEQRKAEQVIRDSEEKLSRIFNSIKDLFFEITLDGKILEMSPSILDIAGYERDEIIRGNINAADFYQNSSDRDKFISALSQSGVLEDYEVVFEHKNGSPIICSITANLITDSQSGEKKIIGSLRDVTKRKAMEEDLRRSEERLRRYFEIGMVGMAMISINHEFIEVNDHLCNMLGYEKEELIQSSWKKIAHPDDIPLKMEHFGKMLTGISDGYSMDCTYICKDGSLKSVNLSVKCIRSLDNSIDFFVALYLDLTERNQLEQERTKAARLESIGILAGGIAHDFNNILTAVMGNLSLASVTVSRGSELSNLISQAEKAAIRAKDLTQQLLTFSKGGAPILVTKSVVDVIRESAEFSLHGSNVKLIFDFAPDLRLVLIDESQISQVIYNMVINADQAMPNGGILQISAVNTVIPANDPLNIKPGEYVEISLKDTGIGIPPDQLNAIFDPYYSTKQKGSGLGLATSYSIIRRHNGTITVESKLGYGTTFNIYLPVSNRNEAEQKAAKSSINTDNISVLLMDDESTVRDTAQMMLKHLGHSVVLINDGHEALNKLDESLKHNALYDIVFLDLTVPGGLGGVDTVKLIRQAGFSVPCIATSGYSNDPVSSDCVKYGFSYFLPKPFTLENLQEAIDKALDGDSR